MSRKNSAYATGGNVRKPVGYDTRLDTTVLWVNLLALYIVFITGPSVMILIGVLALRLAYTQPVGEDLWTILRITGATLLISLATFTGTLKR